MTLPRLTTAGTRVTSVQPRRYRIAGVGSPKLVRRVCDGTCDCLSARVWDSMRSNSRRGRRCRCRGGACGCGSNLGGGSRSISRGSLSRGSRSPSGGSLGGSRLGGRAGVEVVTDLALCRRRGFRVGGGSSGLCVRGGLGRGLRLRGTLTIKPPRDGEHAATLIVVREEPGKLYD